MVPPNPAGWHRAQLCDWELALTLNQASLSMLRMDESLR